jgi:hypothetical protein
MYRLLVKGPEPESVRAAEDRGFDVRLSKFEPGLRGTLIVAAHHDWIAAYQWSAEHREPPFPNGALLWWQEEADANVEGV